MVEYIAATSLLKLNLGLPEIVHPGEPTDEVVKILEYLVRRILRLGDTVGTLDKVSEVLEVYEEGCDLLLGSQEDDLSKILGLESPSKTFVFTWTSVMTGIVTQLRMTYPQRSPQVPWDCGCPPGDTWKDWETYSPGVYLEDEN